MLPYNPASAWADYRINNHGDPADVGMREAQAERDKARAQRDAYRAKNAQYYAREKQLAACDQPDTSSDSSGSDFGDGTNQIKAPAAPPPPMGMYHRDEVLVRMAN